MTLLFNQIRKDIGQTWPLWAVWLGLLAIQVSLLGWSANPADAGMQFVFGRISALVPWLNSFLLLILVPALILQEPTVGTTAFWFTRPLPRGTVVAGKAVLAGILFALPLAAQTVLLVASHVAPHDVALASVEIALKQCGWIAMVAALAVLMPGLGRFAIAGAILYAATLFGGQVVGWLKLLGGLQAYMHQMIDPSLPNSREVVAYGLEIVFGAAVVVHQYFTRRTAVSIALAAAGGLFVMGAHEFWPVDFLKRPETFVSDASLDPSSVKLTLYGPMFANEQPDWRGGAPRKSVQGQLGHEGLPSRFLFEVKKVEGEVEYPGGEELPLRQEMDYSVFFSGAAEAGPVEEALGGIPAVNGPFRGNTISSVSVPSLYSMDSKAYAGHVALAGKASIRFDVRVSAYRIAAEVPAVVGAAFEAPGKHVVVAAVLSQPESVDVTLRERVMNLLLVPRPGQAIGLGDSAQVLYVLVNRKRGEALVQKNAPNFAVMPDGGLFASRSSELTFGLDPNQNQQALPVPIDAAWLADATLVRLEKIPVADFPKTLEFADFHLDGRNLPQRGGFNTEALMGKVDLAALQKISLPEHPTRADAWRYIVAIEEVTNSQMTLSSADPQVDMLQKVGPENVELLLIAMGRYGGAHVLEAVDALAGDADKEMVLRFLARQRDLIKVVTHHHWEADAKPVLLAALTGSTDRHIPGGWIGALVSLQDPATYDAIGAYAEAHPESSASLSELKGLPLPILGDIAARMWQQGKGGNREWMLYLPVAQAGVRDSLDRAAEVLAGPSAKEGPDRIRRDMARTALKSATPAVGATDADLATWYTANRDKLVFNPTTRRFFVPLPPDAEGTPVPTDGQAVDPLDRMKALGQQAAGGDTGAVDQIEALRAKLYDGIDPRNPDQMRQNAILMTAAFDILGKAAAASPDAYKALQYANGKASLRSFACGAYGKAAAGGNADALAALLQYRENGWLRSSVVFALRGVAEQNNEQAVDFLIDVMNDPKAKALYMEASQGLVGAAAQGNVKAKAALEAYQSQKAGATP